MCSERKTKTTSAIFNYYAVENVNKAFLNPEWVAVKKKSDKSDINMYVCAYKS